MTDMEMDLMMAKAEAHSLRSLVREQSDTIANQKTHIAFLQEVIERQRNLNMKMLSVILDDEKCSFGEGVTIKPDGVHELDACTYEVMEVHENVTVEVLRCQKCGHVELSWYGQEDGDSDG